MSDLEKSFQHLIDSAVEKAITKNSDRIQQVALDKERLLSIAELAEYSGFSESTIRRGWIHREHDPLPAYQIDKEYRIPLSTFLKWFERYRVGQKERIKKMINIKEKK